MSSSFSIPFVGASRRLSLRPLRDFLANLLRAQAIATEFAALNALSDTELAQMGLTRTVLKRHLHQKHYARVLGGSQGGWHDPAAQDHPAEPR